jgi:hypothetical protein
MASTALELEHIEESMNNVCRLTLGIAFALIAPFAVFSQTPKILLAPEPGSQASPTIPVDQQPTTEQLNKLFEIMRVRTQLATITKMMPQMMQEQFTLQFKAIQKEHPEMGSMTDDQQKAAAEIMGRYMGKVMGLYTADEMVSDMAAIYQKHLSASDVDATIDYYSSPAGQHMLELVPVIMQEFLPIVTTRVQERIKPVIEQMTKEMEAVIKPQSAPAQN